MKKLLCIILTALMFNACTRDKAIDSALLEKADDIADIPVVEEAEEYMGDYLPETEYIAGDLTQTDGIRYGSGYANALSDGKYYFDVVEWQSRVNEDGSQNSGTARTPKAINLSTGEDTFLCPDPLCDHLEGTCPFIDINCIGYYDGMLYYLRFSYENSVSKIIEKLDPVTGKFTEVFTFEENPQENPSVRIGVPYIIGNLLVYTVETSTEDTEKRTEVVTKELHILDLDTGVEIRRADIPQDLCDMGWTVSCMDENYFYGVPYNAANNAAGFLRTDHNFENRVTLVQIEEYPSYGGMQVDENTGEMFVHMRRSVEGSYSYYGVLCRIVGDEWEILDMPHENITAFQITKDYIYYSAYEPVDLGEARGGRRLIVEDGGKIYRTDRATRTECELIFEDGIEFNSVGWFVLGDNLYLDSTVLADEGGMLYYSPARSLKHVRINLTNHTARYFRFD